MTDQPGYVAPAGWYVDPTTSAHLRWWSGLAWTEHVAPIPEVTAVPDSYPEVAYPEVAPALSPAFAAGAPALGASAVGSQAMGDQANADFVTTPPASALTVADLTTTDLDTTHLDLAETNAAGADLPLPPPPVPLIAPVSAYSWDREVSKTEDAPRRTLPVGYSPEYTAVPSRWGTVSVWVIAFSPWITVVTFIAMVNLEALSSGVWLRWGAFVLPWLITLAAAQRDVSRLRAWGHQKRASWAWALIGAPAYLIARTVVLRRNTGLGSAPLWIWLANFLLVVGACAFFLLMIAAIFFPQNGNIHLSGLF